MGRAWLVMLPGRILIVSSYWETRAVRSSCSRSQAPQLRLCWNRGGSTLTKPKTPSIGCGHKNQFSDTMRSEIILKATEATVTGRGLVGGVTTECPSDTLAQQALASCGLSCLFFEEGHGFD